MTPFILLLIFLACQLTAAQQKPNFIFIFCDDLGFGDLASYGHPYAKTDNIDRLAAEGTAFRQFHVNGNVCMPSRAGIMCSRNPSSFPNFTYDYGFLGATTVTKLLKDSGYVTGHIGKWHIGEDPDTERDEYGIDDLRLTGSIRNDPRGREGQRFDVTISFVEQNKDVPFYLNLWVWTPHSPIDPPDVLKEPFNNLEVDRSLFGYHMQEKFDGVGSQEEINKGMQTYLADVYGLDLQVGRLLDKLDELGLADNTVVVFTSDNGPAPIKTGNQYLGYSGGLRGEKHSYYEGGTRMPFIVRWPGHVPAGRVDDESIMSGVDWLPTVCTLAGVENIPWNHIEGEDMSDVWLGNTRSRTNPLFFREWSNQRFKAMRYGRWKLFIRTDKYVELYDLETDPEERVDLFDSKPDVVLAMLNTMAKWEETLPEGHARFPDEPLPFDPTVPVTVIGPPEELIVDVSPSPTPALTPNPSPTSPNPSPTTASPVDGNVSPSPTAAYNDDNGSSAQGLATCSALVALMVLSLVLTVEGSFFR